MNLAPLEYASINCPYCGSIIDCAIDTSTAEQQYIEDCHICCAPIVFVVKVDSFSSKLEVTARMDNE